MAYKFLTHLTPKRAISSASYWLITLFIICILFANKIPLRINLTASMPQGFYWLSPPTAVHSGDFVMVCLNGSRANYALKRGYLHPGICASSIQPLLKQVAAKAEDNVTLSRGSVVINDLSLPHSSMLANDKLERPLAAIPPGSYKLQVNQLWLYGIKSNRSWDSRYFGLVKVSDVVSIAKPILTW